jgi:hypothetical protein
MEIFYVTLKVMQIFFRTLQKLIMPYTNVDISREKGPKSFFRKSLGVTKMGKKNISDFFVVI